MSEDPLKTRGKRKSYDSDAKTPPNKRKLNDSSEDGNSSFGSARRSDYKEYYKENADRMRENNRRYYQKVNSDPEKRRLYNEKKKLAMRKVLERRKAAKTGTPIDIKQEPETPKKPAPKSKTAKATPVKEEPKSEFQKFTVKVLNDSQVVIEEEIVEEVAEEPTTVTEEVEDITEEVHVEVEQAEEVAVVEEEEQPMDMVFQDTIGIYNSLIDSEAKARFIEYIEGCAREFQRDNANWLVVEEEE